MGEASRSAVVVISIRLRRLGIHAPFGARVAHLAPLGRTALASPGLLRPTKGLVQMCHDARRQPGSAVSPIDANALERAVVEAVVDLHPIQLTLAELIRELTDTPDDFASRDRIEIAVQQLARAGLLHRHSQYILPTRALLRAIELDLG